MTCYGDYVDPYELENRGIERMSIVYGVVPVHEDGSPLKQSAYMSHYPTEYPEPETPRKVAKGIVEKIGKRHEIGLFRK